MKKIRSQGLTGVHIQKKIDGHMDFCWFDSIFSSSYTWLMLKNPTIDYWILHKYIMWHKVVFLNWSRLPFSLKIFILFHSTHPHKFWTVNCLNEWFMRSNKLIIQLFLFLFLFFSLSLFSSLMTTDFRMDFLCRLDLDSQICFFSIVTQRSWSFWSIWFSQLWHWHCIVVSQYAWVCFSSLLI